jgi:inner membrane transporter RhtA
MASMTWSSSLMIPLTAIGFGAITLAGIVTATGGAAMLAPMLVSVLWDGLRKLKPPTLAGLVTAIGRVAKLVPVLVSVLRDRLRKLKPPTLAGLASVLRDGLRKLKADRVGIAGGVTVLAIANFGVNFMYGVGISHVSVAFFWAANTAGLLIGAALPKIMRVRKSVPESERVRAWTFVWPVLALVGVILLVRPWEGDFDVVGLVCSFASGVAMAWRLVYTEKVLPEERIFARGLSGVIGGIGLVAIGFMSEANSVGGHLSGRMILILLVAGVFNVAIPGAAEVFASRRIATSTISVFLAGTPIFALGFTCLDLGRFPTGGEMFAILVVVAGAVGAAWSDKKKVSKEAIVLSEEGGSEGHEARAPKNLELPSGEEIS